MRTSYRAEAVAPVDGSRLWPVVSDVASWPGHTASMSAVRPDGPLAPGMTAEVRQPGLPSTRWTVTDVEEGRSFSWTANVGVVRSTAHHWLEPLGPDRTRLVLELHQDGLLAVLLRPFVGRRVRRFLKAEADGLTAACR